MLIRKDQLSKLEAGPGEAIDEVNCLVVPVEADGSDRSHCADLDPGQEWSGKVARPPQHIEYNASRNDVNPLLHMERLA